MYSSILALDTPCIVTDLPSAELVKLAANSFLATKISFINAIAEVCEMSGADVVTVADAIGLDNRIGRRFLNAGVGFGGGCLGKDIRAFRARASELGIAAIGDLLGNVDAVNEGRRQRVVDLAVRLLDGDLIGRRVCVLGAAFKPNSDDVRDSPALDVARRLDQRGAVVRVHDPRALSNARHVAPGLCYVETAAEALEGAALVLLLTEWDEYRHLDAVVAATYVDRRVLIDGRNIVDRQAWSAAGWECHALGRQITPPAETRHLTLPSEEIGALRSMT